MLYAQLIEHPFHGVALGVPWGGHLGAVVGEDSLELDAVLHVKEIDGLQSSEHHGETLDVSNHFGPGQPGEGVDEAHQVVAVLCAHDGIPAEVVGCPGGPAPLPGS